MRGWLLPLIGATLLCAGRPALAAYPCDKVATELRALDARHVRLEGWFVVEALAERKTSAIRARTDYEDILQGETLPTRLTKIGLSAADFPELADGFEGAMLRRSGPLGVVQVSAGNLNCNQYYFFETRRGKSRRIAVPPQIGKVRQNTGLSYCYTQHGWLGSVDKNPAFIDETMAEGDNHSVVRISLWRNHRWGAICQLEDRYAPVFKVDAFDCRLAKSCVGLRERAERLARLIEANPKVVKAWARQATSARAQSMMALSKREERPFFDIGLYTYALDADAPAFPISIGGTTYLARMGVAVQGMKSLLADNLFIYDLKDDRLVPVAGAFISRLRGRLMIVPQ